MAHGNYDCCAICDCKMEYADYDARTKEDICDICFKKIKELNLPIETVDDLKKYIKETDCRELEENLIKLKYKFCCYGNEIDELVLLAFQPMFMSFEEYVKRIDTLHYELKEKE